MEEGREERKDREGDRGEAAGSERHKTTYTLGGSLIEKGQRLLLRTLNKRMCVSQIYSSNAN